ncbi:MAG TPA: hypothetical protein VK179_15435 [Bacteroidales bacterium]|nr:hypothetical protein [Bacteroidales bacterium]
MNNFIRSARISRFIAAMLIVSFLNLMNGCYFYKVVPAEDPPEVTMQNLSKKFNFYILHSDDQVKHIFNISVDTIKISGTLEDLSGHIFYKTAHQPKPNRYRRNESAVNDEVHIYASGLELKNGSFDIPLKSIQKIEVYDPATGLTVASWVFSFMVVGASIAGIISLIILLTKESCPFVYTFDGNNYSFTGEIFSGATQPGIEREDYLPLQKLYDKDGFYSVKISNKIKEIQHINLAELVAIDHPADVSVLVDKNGRLQTFHAPVKPLSCINAGGINILPLINSRDSLFYTGDPKMISDKGIEEVILTFNRPASADSAKLIVRAKNDFWLETVIARFHDMFGDAYTEFSKKQEKASGEELRKWMSDQHIPLTVYVEKEGQWVLIDYFNIAGPMAFKDDILAFNLDGIKSDTLTIKLDYGFLFWDIDYAGIDFTHNSQVTISECPLMTATDENGIDRKQALSVADTNYYDQEIIGNEVNLTFEKPAKANQARTLLLHSKGYYKILRNPQGKPQTEALREFRKADRLPGYSHQLYLKTISDQSLSLTH